MLKITTNVPRSGKPEIPIFYNRKNKCINCGAEGSLAFIDRYGKEARGEYKPFDHIVCKHCGEEYNIFWQKTEDSAKMYPSAVDSSTASNFTNMVNAVGASNRYID